MMIDSGLKEKLKDYVSKNRKASFALRDWLTLKNKDYGFLETLACIYRFAGGKTNEMTKVIGQLTEKPNVYGRTQVYNQLLPSVIDINRDENGELTLTGYNPKKEAKPKGQHVSRNKSIFRKSDDQVRKDYQRSEERLMDIGSMVRGLYPSESNDYITFAINAVRKYSAIKKINPSKVVDGLKNGKLVMDDRFFTIKPSVSDSYQRRRVVIIRESVLEDAADEFKMTEYKFKSNVRKFLSDLLGNPVTAQPPSALRRFGYTRSSMIGLLLSNHVIERDSNIVDKDSDGNPKTAMMKVKYRVPKKGFDRKIRDMYIKLFERNVPSMVNEEGEAAGATSAMSSGAFEQPLFQVIDRKPRRKSGVEDEYCMK